MFLKDSKYHVQVFKCFSCPYLFLVRQAVSGIMSAYLRWGLCDNSLLRHLTRLLHAVIASKS